MFFIVDVDLLKRTVEIKRFESNQRLKALDFFNETTPKQGHRLSFLDYPDEKTARRYCPEMNYTRGETTC
jgi:hypothetical protein